jgi:hypothetical protein
LRVSYSGAGGAIQPFSCRLRKVRPSGPESHIDKRELLDIAIVQHSTRVLFCNRGPEARQITTSIPGIVNSAARFAKQPSP